MDATKNCLDNILLELGDFGKYQRRITLFFMVTSFMLYFPSAIWLFETKQVNYRCEVPECESVPTHFKPSWWSNAIPSVENEPAQCVRYQRISNSDQQRCDSSNFDKNVTISCDKYIYETQERSIIQDFDLHCKENLWKLTLVGTINGAGLFIGLPISGFLSDKYGRKTILIGSLFLCAVSGLIRSFSNSYNFLIVMELLDSILRAGAIPAGFTLGAELVGPSKRAVIITSMHCSITIGLATAGVLAWLLQTWRPLLQILYGVMLIAQAYYRLIPESVRWLLANKRYAEVRKILKKIAITNGKTISEESLKQLFEEKVTQDSTNSYPLKELFKSFTLTTRFINCSVCWIITIFVYYGMTITSVSLSENSYLDFILTSLVVIPAHLVSYLIVDRIGRRLSFSGGFVISALACFGFVFIPEDLYWLRICIYLFGKFGSAINITVIYFITPEIFPTPLRSRLVSVCSMFGRIGALLAPQMPLLALVWKPLPLVLFGTTSLIASVLSLLLPETMNVALPDTVTEAKNIGKMKALNKMIV